jgi:hypothetical protein
MFRLGQQVECIDDKPNMWTRQWLQKGKVYTIRAMVTGWFSGAPALELEEVSSKNPGLGVRLHFRATRFRPLTRKITETTFTEGADPKSGKFDNRRKRGRVLPERWASERY